MKLVLIEDETEAVGQLLAGQLRVSSALIAVEVERAVLRADPPRVTAVPEVLAGVTLLGLGRAILDRAARLPPRSLRTLDAIHLASALLVADDLDGFVCYDARLADAAASLGLRVFTPGNPEVADGV